MSDQLPSFAAASTQMATVGSQRCHLYRSDWLETSVSPTTAVPAMVGFVPGRALETEATATAMAATARSVAAANAPRLGQRSPATFSPAVFTIPFYPIFRVDSINNRRQVLLPRLRPFHLKSGPLAASGGDPCRPLAIRYVQMRFSMPVSQ
jgi:hypothetical protein